MCVDKSELAYFAWSDKILLWGHDLDIPLPFPEKKIHFFVVKNFMK